MAQPRRNLVATLFIALALWDSVAQEAPPPNTSISLSIYCRGSADWEGLFYFADPATPVELELYRGGRSDVYNYSGPRELALFRQYTSDDGEVAYRAVTSATIPETNERQLLAFLTPLRDGAKQGDREFNLALMPDIEEVVPIDHLVFFNGSGARLLGILGDQQIDLNPGLSKPISTKEFQSGKDIRMGLTVRYQDTFKIVLENYVRFFPNRRNLVVLLPPEEPNSFKIVAFRLDKHVTPSPQPRP